MENIIEIKAKSRESAITRAIKILGIDKEQIKEVKELKKPFSFFGLFSREGIYKIEVTSEEEKREIKNDDVISLEKKECECCSRDIVVDENKLDEIKRLGIELLEKMGLNLKLDVNKRDNRNYQVSISGEDNGIIIGKKGKTLNSYEYLLSVMIKDVRIEVDVEGFKEKRDETLRELAKKMSEKALKTNRPIRLNPMPPRERKIIHEVINKYPKLVHK